MQPSTDKTKNGSVKKLILLTLPFFFTKKKLQLIDCFGYGHPLNSPGRHPDCCCGCKKHKHKNHDQTAERELPHRIREMLQNQKTIEQAAQW